MESNVVGIMSFSKRRNASSQSLRTVALLRDRWSHHLSPLLQFRQRTGWEGNILQPPALLVSAATTHKTFGLTDLTSTYSMCFSEGIW
ncbi:hypothetical protein TNCV_4447281 [Trichonephila clavipes]|nr:hypothetical protein TNCV_4447281 [Trichonephila clavipes]